MTHRFQALALALVFAFNATGCETENDSKEQTYSEYRERERKVKEALTELQKEIEKSEAQHRRVRDALLKITAELVGIEAHSRAVTELESAMRSQLPTASAAEVNMMWVSFSKNVDDAIAAIDDLEREANEGMSALRAELSPSAQQELKDLFDASAKFVNDLRGLKEVFRFHKEVMRAVVENRLKELSAPSLGQETGPQPSTSQQSGPTGAVRGQFLMPNKIDPISGALVYAPRKGNENLGGTVHKGSTTDPSLPPEDYLAKTTTDQNGNFVLRDLPPGNVEIRMTKGPWVRRTQAPVVANKETPLPKSETALPTETGVTGEVPAIAVLAGSYDHMETVLEKKIGLPRSRFDFINDAAKMTSLFTKPGELGKYKLVVINCGTAAESVLSGSERAVAVANIQKFVKDGGRLFVTDLAYDFVEQAFPDAIKFVGDTGATAGAIGAAERGKGGMELFASIASLALKGWMDNMKCGSKPCLETNGSVKIGGFLGGWAMMESTALGSSVMVKGTAEGAERPLTVLFSAGKGRVFYSSYHTHHAAGDQIVPQERILQYFMFEVVQ